MNDASTLVVLTAPLVIASVFDWWVARGYFLAAREKPHIPNLTAGASVRIGIAIAATIATVLGILSTWFLLTGQRVLPQPWGTVLLYAIAIVPSIANLPSLPVVRSTGDDE